MITARSGHMWDCNGENLVQDVTQEFCIAGLAFGSRGSDQFFIRDK